MESGGGGSFGFDGGVSGWFLGGVEVCILGFVYLFIWMLDMGCGNGFGIRGLGFGVWRLGIYWSDHGLRGISD